MTFAYVRKASENQFTDIDWWVDETWGLMPNLYELLYAERKWFEEIERACKEPIDWWVFASEPRNPMTDYQWYLIEWKIK